MSDAIDLSGAWTVRLDPERAGVDEEWFETPVDGELVDLPGALRESGVGEPVSAETEWIGQVKGDPTDPRFQSGDAFRMPYWLQPERHYVGVAWYEREVDVPDSWAGRHLELHLERPHWETTLWVDGRRVGACDSLSTPHDYDLTDVLSPGRHRLTLRIDNSLDPVDVGWNAHSVSDHTQTAWHGVVGDLSLRAAPQVHVADAQVVPDADGRTARVAVRLGNDAGAATAASVDLSVADDAGDELAREHRDVTVPAGGTAVETALSLGPAAPLWDEHDPSLCRLDVAVLPEDDAVGAAPDADRTTVRFGLRDVGTAGSRVAVNGRPVALRGTLECCVFPETGYPPTDEASWRAVFATCADHGLNHVRFHSWCPPEAAFAAADDLGIYLQVECSSWPNGSTSLGEGRAVDDWLYAEGERVLDAYGNHPSLLLLAAGNEPGGDDEAYLGEWVETFRERARRCLVTGGSGWPVVEANEVHVTPEPRVHAWGEGLDDRLNAAPPATTADYRTVVERHPETPTLAHESGQWCAYPNLDETGKYTGALSARNFEAFRDLLEEAGLGDRARDFLAASGALQERCYEEEVESALRTPGMAGFQLLMLHDFPGQGTAPVGMLDAFFDDKPYHDAERVRRYAGATVPLARLDRRTFAAGETLVAGVELSHFGPRDLAGAVVEWELTTDGGRTVAEGHLDAGTLATGSLHRIGEVRAVLDGVDAPQRFSLAVGVAGTDARNDWDVWVYPAAAAEMPDGVHVAATLEEATPHLRAGEPVALLADPERVATDVEMGFTPVFWNTAWTENQAPHTLGLLPDPDHPALAAFPTDAHTDWQWWDPVANGAPMELDGLGDLEPVVQVVPDWFDPRKLGLLFEARVLDGRLLVCSIDLREDLDDRPVARQLRRSLLDYAASAAFDPDAAVAPEAVAALFASPAE